MGEVQLWQADGLGTDKETLEKCFAFSEATAYRE